MDRTLHQPLALEAAYKRLRKVSPTDQRYARCDVCLAAVRNIYVLHAHSHDCSAWGSTPCCVGTLKEGFGFLG
jgi:hypothetical protein